MGALRVLAWSILRSGSPTPLRSVGPAAARSGLDARDRALLRRLIGCEVRHRASLRAIVRRFAARKPKPDLAAHLHLAIVQLLWLDRVPDHAALSETFDAVHRTLGGARVRATRDVLHAVAAARREGRSGDPRRDLADRDVHLSEPVFRDPEAHPLLWAEDALSIPAALLARWSRRHGRERALALARGFLREPPLALRPVGCTAAELAAELEAQGVAVGPGVDPARGERTLRAEAGETGALAACEAFRRGRVAIQGETALRAAELVGAAPGELVLDLCAAPGGKSAVLAGAGARVVAADRDPARLARVSETARRLGLEERILAVATDAGAAFGSPASVTRTGRFDAVLVDAPCTNTGVLGARPGARWRFGPATLRELGALQARLLRRGAELVRPGGRLVWSTCSLEPEENGQRVRRFLEAAGDWDLEVEEQALPDAEAGPIDGGYAARLRRRE